MTKALAVTKRGIFVILPLCILTFYNYEYNSLNVNSCMIAPMPFFHRSYNEEAIASILVPQRSYGPARKLPNTNINFKLGRNYHGEGQRV